MSKYGKVAGMGGVVRNDTRRNEFEKGDRVEVRRPLTEGFELAMVVKASTRSVQVRFDNGDEAIFNPMHITLA